MDFEWDEAKRAINLEKHGIDFLDARQIWQGSVLDPYVIGHKDSEIRVTAIGTIGDDDRIFAVIYTLRGSVTRIISARRARPNERKDYQSRFGRGS